MNIKWVIPVSVLVIFESAALVCAEGETTANSSLPQVESGVRPGPDILYAEPFRAPQLVNHDPYFRASPLLVSGQEAYLDGEYIYQDHIYDDYGSDTDGTVITAVNLTQPQQSGSSLRSGEIEYPRNPARYGGNAADLVEFRIAVAPDAVAYRVTLNTLLERDSTIIAIVFDTDRDLSTGVTTLPRDPGASFPGTDEVLFIWGTGAEHTSFYSPAPVTTPLEVRTDLEANQMTVIVPRHVSNPRGIWLTTVAAGLLDPVTGGWLRPGFIADEIQPGGAGPLDPAPCGIFNLAFRFDEPANVFNPPDAMQAAALRNHNPTQYAHNIRFDDLDSGVNSSTVPAKGVQLRIFPSRIPGEGRDFSKLNPYLGRLQPYFLYIPSSYTAGTPHGLTFALHPDTMIHTAYNGLNFIQQIGEQRNSFVATPLSRSAASDYKNVAEFDFFEVWNDIARHFTLDPDRTAICGYSAGGYATYRLGTLYPDLFGKALTIVAPPVLGEWIPGVPAVIPIDDRPEGLEDLTNLYLENARHLPYMNLVALEDEASHFTMTRAQNLGAPEVGVKGFDQHGYRFHFLVYEAAEHLTLFLLDDFPTARDFLSDALVDRDPAHVTFAYIPASDNTELGLIHNHAYWVSGLGLNNSDWDKRQMEYPPKGFIDVFSHAFGWADPVSVAGSPTPGFGPLPYTEFNRTWMDPLPSPKINRLDMRLINLAEATIDMRRAGMNLCEPIELGIENDSPCTLHLAGKFSKVSVTGAEFNRDANGVTLFLRTGVVEVLIHPSCTRSTGKKKLI